MNRAELAEALARHRASDPDEAESLAWMRRLLAAPADPFSRSNPEGHFTGSAVVARPDGSAFLLVLHRKLGRWLQPGGHTEESDASIFDSARREACEETGIPDFETPLGREILDVDVHEIPARRGEPAHFHFDVRYLFTTARDHDPAASEDPSRPMRWIARAEALASGADASLARALDKAHALLHHGLQSGAGKP